MNPIRVLFVCIHNSARSQMAQAYLEKMGAGIFVVESAGLEAGALNPYAIQAMKDDGIDISARKTKSAFELLKQGREFDYVITVCDEASAATCPVFPGQHQQIHWNFEDPSAFTGSEDAILEKTILVRNKVREAVSKLIVDLKK